MSFKSSFSNATKYIKKIGSSTKEALSRGLNKLKGSIAFPALSQDELLEWSKDITESKATIYDKALDAEYLRTHIGGGNHRMFDGGHDLISAWGRAKDALPDDTFLQEVLGYSTAIFKDFTTLKGMPFITFSKESYDSTATWVTENIPGVSRDWIYDLLSFDAFELLSSTLGVVGAIFFLKKNDIERISEILGAMGISSIIGANPVLGIIAVLITAWSYVVNKQKIDKKKLARGAGLAGISAIIFMTLGLPFIIELGLVMIVTKQVGEKLFNNQELIDRMKRHISTMLNSKELAPRISNMAKNILAHCNQILVSSKGKISKPKV